MLGYPTRSVRPAEPRPLQLADAAETPGIPEVIQTP